MTCPFTFGSAIRMRLVLASVTAAALFTISAAAAESIDLAGSWRCELDRANTGHTQRWFDRALGGTIPLPGSLEASRLGDAVAVDTTWTGGIFGRAYFTDDDYAPYRRAGNIKFPFWLQPDTHYTGAAWFQREITVPENWQGQRLVLSLERPHWKTTLWLDGTEIERRDSLSVAHEYDLGTAVPAGRHRLTLRVENQLDPDVGENSHSVSDHTQGNWNGIVGRLVLTRTAPIWVDELQINPHAKDRTATVRGRVAAASGTALPASVRVQADNLPALTVPVAIDGRFTTEYTLGASAALWDEFNPALHSLTVVPEKGEPRSETFGLRTVAVDGRQLLINGRKLFLRGALDCAAFPRTGHPPTDVESWRREFRVIRAHGLNHIRFHSWCPPEAAFAAADELGVYLQVEVASWPNWSTTIGDGKPVDAWLEAESQRILRAYGNHPSFVLFCACNEPGGVNHPAWLGGWIERRKAEDPQRLYNAGAGWPEIPQNDFHLRSEPRIQHWSEGLKSRINRMPPETVTDYRDYIGIRTVPVISHEIGQWCVYPNFAEMPKYTGYLKPKNFEIFQASLAAHHMADQARDFLMASGKLQALCYKEDIESALRTPAMGGFQLLGLADFPGQGTALVGVVDAFWEEKGYISPAEFRRFCGPTVPLARLGKRIFTNAESLTADVEVAHFGPTPVALAAATWRLSGDDGRSVATGKFPPRAIAVGTGNSLGKIEVPLAHLPVPARYRLTVSLDGNDFTNDWDVWVYAATLSSEPPSAGVLETHELDARALDHLAAGGRVFLEIPPQRVKPDAKHGPIALGFSSIFWNTAWTSNQAPHTLGILCDPKHPALRAFPTDSHTNWQWWYPLQQAAPMILDDLPATLRPLVQVIDDWVTNRKLGLVFEARVGTGRLLVTSIQFDSGSLDLVRRQLRTSLLSYLASPDFAPSVEVTPAQIRAISTP